MRFTNDMTESLNEQMKNRADGSNDVLRVEIGSTGFVYHDSLAVCSIEDIPKMVKTLEYLKETIEEETYVVL